MTKLNYGLGVVFGVLAVLALLNIASGAACSSPITLTSANHSCSNTSISALNLTITNSNTTTTKYAEINVTTNQSAGSRENVSLTVGVAASTSILFNVTALEYLNGSIDISFYTNMTAPWNITFDFPLTNVSTCSWDMGNTNDTLRVTNYSSCEGELQRPSGSSGTMSIHATEGYISFPSLPVLILASITTSAGVVVIYTLKRRSSA